MSDDNRPEVTRTKAAVRRSWWPGWIWAIPVAAVLLMAWWLLRSLMTGGEDITISFADVHGLKQSNTNVVYRGMNIGRVKGIKLAKDGKTVEVTAHIQDGATRFLRSGTQFWLRGATPELSDLSSLTAVLSGPTVMMEPGPGKKASHFDGKVRKPVISGGPEPPLIYGLSLKGAVGELTQGEPVKLRGFPVGEIKDVGFHYDARTGQLSTPVTLALYPSLFHIEGAGAADRGAALASAIDRLIRQGLRARLSRNPPLVGTAQVALEIAPGTTAAEPAVVHGIPQIPAAPGGGLNSIVDRINSLPLERIAQNLLDTSHHLDDIVSSPQLKDALLQMDATLRRIHAATAATGPQIPKLADSLRRTAARVESAAKAAQRTAKAAESTAKAADRLLGGASSQTGLQSATSEITEAARAVRELANYLDRHPEAMIEGRGGQ